MSEPRDNRPFYSEGNHDIVRLVDRPVKVRATRRRSGIGQATLEEAALRQNRFFPLLRVLSAG
jgi:hypothetical protein